MGFISGNIGYIGILENRMETTIIYWGYIGIMETRMETTTMGYIGFLNSLFFLGIACVPQIDLNVILVITQASAMQNLYKSL